MMLDKKPFNIWEGVYSSFQEAPRCGDGFEQANVLAAKSRKFRDEIALAKQKRSVPRILFYGESLLPFLAGVLADKYRVFRILDFGGGLGQTYLRTKTALSGGVQLKYIIVDQERVCVEGKKLFRGCKDVFFVSEIPVAFSAHIVHIGSALQYVENWEKALAVLSGRCLGYFLFTDLPAGDIPTYISTQYYYGSRMPYRFFNIKEFIKKMECFGYRLMFKSSFSSNILGQYQDCPQDNFNVKYRLGKTCNLLFKKRR